jgi:hypothetical protein
VAIKFKVSPTVDLNRAISQFWALGNLESSGVETPERRNPETPLDRSPRSWPEVAWSDGEELCQRPKAHVFVTEEDLCDLEASRLT